MGSFDDPRVRADSSESAITLEKSAQSMVENTFKLLVAYVGRKAHVKKAFSR